MGISIPDAARLRAEYKAKDISFTENGATRFYFGAVEIEVDDELKMTFARRTGSKLVKDFHDALEANLADDLALDIAHNEAMVKVLEGELSYLEMRIAQIKNALGFANLIDKMLDE